jgi:hypothetical protein
VLSGGGKDQERLLFKSNHQLGLAFSVVVHIVNFAFAKYESLCFDSPLFESDSAGHIFDILHYEVHRNAVIAKAWNYDISVNGCWKHKIAKCSFHKLVVLFQYANNAAAAFSSVPFEPAAESEVI